MIHNMKTGVLQNTPVLRENGKLSFAEQSFGVNIGVITNLSCDTIYTLFCKPEFFGVFSVDIVSLVDKTKENLIY